MKNRRPKSGWLWLTLELIAVFIDVTAGFLFDNFREDSADRNLENATYKSLVNSEFCTGKTENRVRKYTGFIE